MERTINEPGRDIPVLTETDVLVAGGGVSGCASARAAAEAGARTVLIERNGCLGGVATASLMANIGNGYLLRNNEQVVRGFAGKVINELVARGGASAGWKHRDVPGCVIDSEMLKVVLIDMLQEAGVEVLTHAPAARPIMEGAVARGAFIESKSGRQAIAAKAVVDCTGEVDLAAQAGAETLWRSGSASTLFKLANVDLDSFVTFLQDDPEGFPAGKDMVRDLETFTANWKERGILFFPHVGGPSWRFMQGVVKKGEFRTEIGPAWKLDALGMYALKGTGFIVINSNFYRIEDLDIRRLSAFELHAQKMCYYVADVLRAHVPGFENAVVAHVGVDLGVRGSRYIVGRETLPYEAVRETDEPTYYETVIGTTPACDGRLTSGDSFRNYTCDVPFGVTVPQGCENILVASGKSISTRPPGLLRLMNGCMMCGQAAGAAAALGAKSGTNAEDVPIRDVQRELLRQDVHLGGAERLADLGLS